MNAGSKHPQAHQIVQLTKDDEFIKYWGCIKEAASQVGVSASCIRDCLVGKQKSSGGYKWMDKKEYNKLNRKQRFVIVSDIHGFYDEMIDALDKANFNPETDFLICLGDITDRGPENLKVIKYLNSLPNKILISGNHEDLVLQCCSRRYWEPHDISNGTMDTICEIGGAGYGRSFDECCVITEQIVKPFFNNMVNYFESEHYIFVHSFIPLIKKDEFPMYYIKNRNFVFNPDWRYAHASEWEEAKWGNPFDLAERGFLPDKTIVFGHWGTECKWAEIEGRKAYDENAHFEPYYGNGYIGIDATTAYSHKVNVLVLEDNFI